MFPADAVLSVEPVPGFDVAEADGAVAEVRDADMNVAVRYSFNIKMADPQTGEEYQPADGEKVRVFFSLAEAADQNLETDVYHVTEDEDTGVLSAEKLDIIPEEKIPGEPALGDPETIVAVETDGFSYYTVEFTYSKLQYVMEGDSSVPMSEILAVLGLTGEVTAVEVSSSELFSASNETGEWIVTAHQAFDTDEWMKVTINDVVYEITVKDDSGEQIDNVKYWDHSWDGTAVSAEEKTRNGVNVVPSNGAMTSGWYILNSDVTVNSRICLTGDTYLILGDGYTLDVKGLYIPKGSTLRIYGQRNGSGYLYSHPSSGAGIGAYSGHKGGAVEIHGGVVRAEGYDHCAGIGGNDDDRTDIGGFTMFDGNVTAIGGDSGAGIGGGRACEGGTITIYGGTVTAEGGHYGAGIGGGNGQDTSPMRGAHGGTITIWGGTVDATGGDDGAGIGGGEGGNAGTIVINGGTVTAQGGNNGAGIGCGEGESTGIGGTVTINGGIVNATGGGDAAGIGGGVDSHCGTITINGTLDGTNVTATGGSNGAGIGAGRDADGGTIKITGGTIIAEGKDSSAGIGGADASDDFADYSNIEISGGDVTATGNSKGAGIGGGEYGHATITITGGVVKAYGGSSGGAAIGNGKDGSGSMIILGYTDASKDTISITAGSYSGIVKLNQPFKNDTYNFYTTNAVSSGDLPHLSAGALKAWDNAVAPATEVTVNSWAALQNAINGAEGKITITLAQSISAGSEPRIEIPSGLDVTIDLNGKEMDRGLNSLAGNGQVIAVFGTLTVKDSAGGGEIKGGWSNYGGGIYVERDAACVITGGTITGNHAANGGGIYVVGTLQMTGGEVTGNTANNSGGGIYIAETAAAQISGDTISGNTAGQWGGGIYLADGGAALSLSGGSIRENTCDSDGNGEGNGGGIHVSGTASMTISGNPVVSGNKKDTGAVAADNNVNLADGAVIYVADTLDPDASIGVGMSNPACNITSGLKGNGTADNFSCDNPAYTLALDGAGEAYLKASGGTAITAGSWTELQDKINSAPENVLTLIELDGDIINTENKTRIMVCYPSRGQ